MAQRQIPMVMGKTKQKQVEDIVQPKGMIVFTGIDKYKPIPRFKSGCKNC